MFKHLMARLLNLGLFMGLFIICNLSACAATSTSGVKNTQTENQVIKTITTPAPSPTATPKKKEKIIYKKGWTKDTVNIRKSPSKKGKILGTYHFNKKIKYLKHNKKWVKIIYKKQNAYISKKLIKTKKIKSTSYTIPKHSGYKCGEYYTAITCKSSPQYKLQHQYAYTGKYGIRMVNNRFCVAIGSHFKCKVGQYFTLVLKNGTKIECIKGDEKADRDTDSRNIFSRNGCMSEFLITKSLTKKARLMGDISYCNKKWKSPVVKLIVYKKNVLKK